MLARSLIPCLTAILFLGCGGDDEAGSTRPVEFAIPSGTTMAVDFSAIQEKPGAGAGVCHGLSALALAWVNANVAVRLAVPTLAFAAAVQEEPVYVGDDTWRWTTTGGAGAGAWTAELEASLEGAGVTWAMRVSGTPRGLDRFLWFGGTSDWPAQEGIWHFYDPESPGEPREVVEVEWAAHTGIAHLGLIFRNVDPESAESGDLLAYTVNGSTASVIFEDASAEAASIITWDMSTGAGSATDPEGETCCWGSGPQFADVPCSP